MNIFKNKNIKIILSKNASEEIFRLKDIIGKEIIKGIHSSEHQTLLRSIERVFELLKQNPFAGDQIPKRLIPKIYIEIYNINNLWRVELSNFWRMTYTVRTNELEIINFVLEIVDHKRYDKIFGYEKK